MPNRQSFSGLFLNFMLIYQKMREYIEPHNRTFYHDTKLNLWPVTETEKGDNKWRHLLVRSWCGISRQGIVFRGSHENGLKTSSVKSLYQGIIPSGSFNFRQCQVLRKKCLFSELLWSIFSCIQTEYKPE